MQTANKPTTVMLVDDERHQFLLIGYLLSQAHNGDYRLIWCQDLEDGLHQIEHFQCDVVLLDYHWGAASKDFIHQAHVVNSRIPIIIMTDGMEPDVDRKAISEGASDYLVKDHISPEILERTIRYSIERKKIEQHLDHLAHYDHLTDLPNRILFSDRLQQAISLGHRAKDQFTLMYIDLNGFKEVNDNHGHDVGDRLLQEFAIRLKDSVRRSDTIARIGGDEFTVLLNNIGSAPKIIAVAQKLIDAIREPFYISGRELSVGCSIGIAVFPEAGTDADVLQRHADMAMYQAKQSGASSYRFSMRKQSHDEVDMERLSVEELQTLIDTKKIILGFTPRLNVDDNSIRTVEINAVWSPDSLNAHHYKNFIANIGNPDTLRYLGEWVLDNALSLFAEQVKESDLLLSFSVNSRQLQSPRFGAYVQKVANKNNIPVNQLEFTVLSQNNNGHSISLEECIDNVNNMGARFALKKYGESTLNLVNLYRHDIPVLHLSPSLVQVTLHNKQDVELLESLIAIAHRWGRKVVAGGIVSEEHLVLLRALGCDQIKGQLVGEQLSYAELANCLNQKRDAQLILAQEKLFINLH